MKTSEQINEVVSALSKAQGKFATVKKSGKNPMFKSAYATFDDIIAAVRAPLAENGLSFSQILGMDQGIPTLSTILFHESGQFIGSETLLILGGGNRGTSEVQVFGSALTYMKRYALAALLGVASDEDDDGNDASKTKSPAPPAPKPPVIVKSKPTPADVPENASLDDDALDADIAHAAKVVKAFESPEKAIAWGIAQGAFGQGAATGPLARKAYNDLKDAAKPASAEEMAALWRADVTRKLAEKELA